MLHPYLRLVADPSRKYPPNKLTENITAEIMQTCLSETRESYAEEIIVELSSSGEGDDVDENIRRLESWVNSWVADRAEDQEEE